MPRLMVVCLVVVGGAALAGVTRGFRVNTRVLSPRGGMNPISFILAASKPRFRQQILSTGFFHPRQRESRQFLKTFAQATVPADREALIARIELQQSYEEVAIALGKPSPDAARMAVMRSVKALIKAMQELP
jgi:hypothetical protein